MTEREKIEKQYSPDRGLARYKRQVMASRMSPNRKEQAIRNYAEAQELMKKLTEAAHAAFEALPGKQRLVQRRYAGMLARSLGACARKEAREYWPKLMAERCVLYVRRGMDVELVRAVVRRCWPVIMPLDGEEVLEQMLARLSVLLESAPVEAPEPARSSPQPLSVGEALAAELEQPTDFELLQRRQAARSLKQALLFAPPTMKRCVVERVGRGRAYSEIAGATGLSREGVADLLARARLMVRKFTCFFEDDSYWMDLPPARQS